MAHDPDSDHQGLGVLLGAVVVALCCVFPLLAVVAGGALAAVGGLAARFWPLIVVGVAVAGWAAAKLTRIRSASRPGQAGQERSGRRRR